MNFTIGATSFLEDSAVENEAAKKLPRGGRAKSLGNNGRDVLRREITKRLRAFPQLRIVANRTAPLRSATVPQLYQIAEDVGMGGIALAISEADEAHRKSRRGSRGNNNHTRQRCLGGRSDVNVKEAIADRVEKYRWLIADSNNSNDSSASAMNTTALSGISSQGATTTQPTDSVSLDLHLCNVTSPSSAGVAYHNNINSLAVPTAAASGSTSGASSTLGASCWDDVVILGPLSDPLRPLHEKAANEHNFPCHDREYSAMGQMAVGLPTCPLWDIKHDN